MTEIQLPWKQAGWFEEVSRWITEQLSARGAAVNGPIEQPYLRPWSTVLRAPTDRGAFYFKAAFPVLAHEPGLAEALAGWRPDVMQTVLAVDTARGWMLMPDESPALRAIIQDRADMVYHWERILPLYAGMQQELAGRNAELIDLGMMDRRLSLLPGLFAQLLEDRPAMLIDQEDGLTSAQYHQLTELVPQYEQMCRRLASFGIPETLHHDDFHDANVFVPGGRYAFSDWAESCVTHPFFTMLVCLRSAAYRFDLPYGAGEHNYQFAPELEHLRDVYLSQWSAYGAPEDLQEAFRLAWRVAMVNRALTWYQANALQSAEEKAKSAYAVPAWLGEFLDALGEDQ